MWAAVALFLAVDVVLFGVGIWARGRQCGVSLALFSSILLLAAVDGYLAAYSIATQFLPVPRALLMTILFALPVVAHYARTVTAAFAHAGAEALFGLRGGRRLDSDFSRARTHAMRNDISGAVTAYWEYFWQENRRDPAPLFAASLLLERQGRYDEAADILRHIIRLFAQNDAVWTRAAYQLASIFHNHLHQPETARYLYRQIVRRAPQSEPGHLAHGHLAGVWRAA